MGESFRFDKGEYITNVKVAAAESANAFIVSMNFKTSKGRILGGGGHSETVKDFEIPEGCAFIGFTGEYDQYINNLKAHYVSLDDISPEARAKFLGNQESEEEQKKPDEEEPKPVP